MGKLGNQAGDWKKPLCRTQVVQEEGGDEGTQEWEWSMDMRKLWPAVLGP